MNIKNSDINDDYLYNLINREENISSEVVSLLSNSNSKEVIENFFKRNINNVDLFSKKNTIALFSVLEELGDINTLTLLIELGINFINSESITEDITDSITELIVTINKDIGSAHANKLIEYLLLVSSKYKENHKIMTSAGVIIIVERWHPELVRVNGKEYWDYSINEIVSIINELKSLVIQKNEN